MTSQRSWFRRRDAARKEVPEIHAVAKVGQFSNESALARVALENQYIFTFDVTVDDAAVMHSDHAFGHIDTYLDVHFESGLKRHVLALKICQRPVLGVLHHQDGQEDGRVY